MGKTDSSGRTPEQRRAGRRQKAERKLKRHAPPPKPVRPVPRPAPQLRSFVAEQSELCYQRKVCDLCFAPYCEKAPHCAHTGSWHDNFAACSMKCGWKLGPSRLGMCHWSCCYSTEHRSFCPVTLPSDHKYSLGPGEWDAIELIAEEKFAAHMRVWKEVEQAKQAEYESSLTAWERRCQEEQEVARAMNQSRKISTTEHHRRDLKQQCEERELAEAQELSAQLFQESEHDEARELAAMLAASASMADTKSEDEDDEDDEDNEGKPADGDLRLEPSAPLADGAAPSVLDEEGAVTNSPSLPVMLPAEPPDEFCCPITFDIMQDPVIASDGHSQSRTKERQWRSGWQLTQPHPRVGRRCRVLSSSQTTPCATSSRTGSQATTELPSTRV